MSKGVESRDRPGDNATREWLRHALPMLVFTLVTAGVSAAGKPVPISTPKSTAAETPGIQKLRELQNILREVGLGSLYLEYPKASGAGSDGAKVEVYYHGSGPGILIGIVKIEWWGSTGKLEFSREKFIKEVWDLLDRFRRKSGEDLIF